MSKPTYAHCDGCGMWGTVCRCKPHYEGSMNALDDDDNDLLSLLSRAHGYVKDAEQVALAGQDPRDCIGEAMRMLIRAQGIAGEEAAKRGEA